jgi:hypothetical protein
VTETETRFGALEMLVSDVLARSPAGASARITVEAGDLRELLAARSEVRHAEDRGYLDGQRRTIELVMNVLQGNDTIVAIGNQNNEAFQKLANAVRELRR